MNMEILNEYTELLKKKVMCNELISSCPRGYISKKTIGNKEYSYLQYRIGRKVQSRYIKEDELGSILMQLDRRKNTEEELPLINKRLSEIEKAAKLLDMSLYRRLSMLRMSSGMDDIASERKDKSLTFSDAMTAIEGVSVSDVTRHELDSWRKGDKSFVSVFEQTLRFYGFIKEA